MATMGLPGGEILRFLIAAVARFSGSGDEICDLRSSYCAFIV
jgi:hypothetical protein